MIDKNTYLKKKKKLLANVSLVFAQHVFSRIQFHSLVVLQRCVLWQHYDYLQWFEQ